MVDEVSVSWGRLAAAAGGVAFLVLAARGTTALLRNTVGELDYHTVDPKAWARWLG